MNRARQDVLRNAVRYMPFELSAVSIRCK